MNFDIVIGGGGGGGGGMFDRSKRYPVYNFTTNFLAFDRRIQRINVRIPSGRVIVNVYVRAFVCTRGE